MAVGGKEFMRDAVSPGLRQHATRPVGEENRWMPTEEGSTQSGVQPGAAGKAAEEAGSWIGSGTRASSG